MNRLLRFRQGLPKFRFCGNFMNGSKCRESRIMVVRTCMSRFGDKTLAKWKAQDSVSEDFDLVYKNDMDFYMYGASVTGWIGISVTLGSIYRILYQDEPISFPIVQLSETITGVDNYMELGIIYSAFICMSLVLLQISCQYVFRMYYNSKTKTYKAIRMGILPTYRRSHDFQAGTLKRIEKIYFVPWWNLQYKSDNVKMLLYDCGFKTFADYHRMFSE